MYILGITESGHNPAACLFHNGKLLNFVEEERLTRVKSAPSTYPVQASLFCLRNNNVSLADVSYVALGWNIEKYNGYMQEFYRSLGERYSKDTTTLLTEEMLLERFSEERVKYRLQQGFMRAGCRDKLPPVIFVDHHLAHAASTFYCSGFESATILTVDAAGEEITTAVWSGDGLELQMIDHYQIPHSLGWFYSSITEFLGFLVNNHEGKVMGLAAYGQENAHIRSVLEKVLFYKDGRYQVDPTYIFYGTHQYGERFTDRLVEELGQPRRRQEPISDFYRDVAYITQDMLEKAVLRIVEQYANREDQSSNLCLAGGVAMNCTMNGVIATSGLVDQLFVQPVSHDAGTALGAAMVVSKDYGFDPRFRMSHAYWGPQYSNDEIRKVLDTAKISYQVLDDVPALAARYLAEGKLIGWFQGAAEVGARALGARSILADPSDPVVRDKLNGRVKFREPWRPFAPSLAAEQASQLFKNDAPLTPFMITSAFVNESARNLIPSAVHVDGSARPQLVSREAHPRYWQLLTLFAEMTSIPAVLNTSFNIKEEPIVCTPHDALRCFFSTGLDALFIEDFLVEKN